MDAFTHTSELTNTTHVMKHKRICAEFDLQSSRFEIVEIEALDSGAFLDPACDDGLARFSIDGRSFVVRRKASSGVAPNAMTPTRPSKLARLLTGREMQIVELLATGLRNKQIASQLNISEYTVAAYVKQICQKLDVHNRTAIAARWLQDSFTNSIN